MKDINQNLMQEILQNAENSPRKRAHHNLHDQLEAPIQRMVIGLVKGTYVHPHIHKASNKWELLSVVQGEIGVLVFDDKGLVTHKYHLSTNNQSAMVELPANCWHCLYPISEQAVLLEIKEGPYTPATPEDFATWAPKEGDANVESFLNRLSSLAIGDSAKV